MLNSYIPCVFLTSWLSKVSLNYSTPTEGLKNLLTVDSPGWNPQLWTRKFWPFPLDFRNMLIVSTFLAENIQMLNQKNSKFQGEANNLIMITQDWEQNYNSKRCWLLRLAWLMVHSGPSDLGDFILINNVYFMEIFSQVDPD